MTKRATITTPPAPEWLARLRYDPITGQFRWACAAPGIAVGKAAGSISHFGYHIIKLGRQQYRAHRLAWLIVHGEWPQGEIDHINGDRTDNRMANLRAVDRAANSQNRWMAHRDNKSCGLLGATWNKQHKRWQAKIVARKVRHHLGYFETPEQAHEAYLTAKKRLHIDGGHH